MFAQVRLTLDSCPTSCTARLCWAHLSAIAGQRQRGHQDSVAFRIIAATQHSDYDTITAFRRHFLEQIEALFVRRLILAREMGVLKLATVALDGPKIHANACRRPSGLP
jgi:transposase